MPRYRQSRWTKFSLLFLALLSVAFSGCRLRRAEFEPSIEFTRVPPAAEGTPYRLETIEGRVSGAGPGQRIVLFARSGAWWVQPLADRPFTAIESDFRWKSSTHPGSEYAALLVDEQYHPPATTSRLPQKGGGILAVASVPGQPAAVPSKTVEFSGYQWEVRRTAYAPGGSPNFYDPANAWTDDQGLLHLRISKTNDHFTSAEVKLTRSLGYGLYRFSVRDVSHLEPAAVLDISARDDADISSAMDIELSRWGEINQKNAQYVIQPYVVPANTAQFDAPGGLLTYCLDWGAGRASFKTFRSHRSDKNAPVVAEHVFTSGVPSPGSEKIHLNLYVYSNQRNPLQRENEVVIEKFDFLP